MSHLNDNLIPNYYAPHDLTSQTLDHPKQVFGDHVHVSHDGSPTYTDAILRHLSPQVQSTHVHHPQEYYNHPHVNSLLPQSYEPQPGWHHYQHGACQVNSFSSKTAFCSHSETDTGYQSISPGPSECTTESFEEPTSASESTNGTRHPCPVPDCGKSFPRASNLKTHMGTHNTHRPFACTLCEYSFARVHDRDRHMNSHLTLKPYACIVCQNRFARQDAVTRHLKMSAETNICAWLLEAKGLPAKEVAAGRVPRSALGEEGEIRETLERMAEEARTMRLRKTEEMLQRTQDMINGTQTMCNTPSN
ncbi:hypothetical protein BGZ81_007155 [Podila clonocystis]|nr:hypothetical protein BGZ81_007155 [Podila clonocystis]